jgi:hypothetical protein
MRIELTGHEQALYKKAQNIEHDYESGSEAMANLYSILKEKDAIPKERLNWFVNSEWNIGTKKSRLQIFESNGTSKENITKHPHFLKHFQYFIEGADLPKKLLDYAYAKRTDTLFDDEWCKEVLFEVKQNKPIQSDRKKFAEEIFKLCADLNINIEEAKSLRQSILKLS